MSLKNIAVNCTNPEISSKIGIIVNCYHHGKVLLEFIDKDANYAIFTAECLIQDLKKALFAVEK
jgi:hypothetical protein